MRRFQTLLGLVLILVFVSSAAAAKGNGARRHRPIRGTVETVSPESVVVKVQQGKKMGGGTHEQTFQLNAATQYEFLTIKRAAKGEKPELETKPASQTDVKAGERVQITVQAASAEKVSILQGKRGKKKAE